MKAREMDRRITLQRKAVAQDGFGEPIETWSDLATVWAQKVESARMAREAPDAGEARAALTRRTFRIRWDSSVSDVNPKDRIVFEGRTYDILGVSELGRREGFSVEAMARAD